MDWIFAVVCGGLALTIAITEIIILHIKRQRNKKHQDDAVGQQAKIINYYPRTKDVEETYYKMEVSKPRVYEDRD